MKLSKKSRQEILQNWFKEIMQKRYDKAISDFSSQIKHKFEGDFEQQILIANKNKDLLNDGYLKACNMVKVGSYYGGICMTDLGLPTTRKLSSVTVKTYAYRDCPHHFAEKDIAVELKSLSIDMDFIKESIKQIEKVLISHSSTASLIKSFAEFERFIPKDLNKGKASTNLISKDLEDSVRALLS